MVSKTDNQTSYLAGGSITYSLLIENKSPNAVVGAVLSDTKPSQIDTWGWCLTPCSPVAKIGGNLSATINIAGNSSQTYLVLANVKNDATGNLENTAAVSVPSGYRDTNPGNNSSTDVNSLTTFSANVSITKTDNTTTYDANGSISYKIVVSNAGPDAVAGATVTDTFDSARLTGISWTCSTTGGATCKAGTNNGDINDIVNIPVNATITYTVSATVVSSPPSGNLVNIATVTLPIGISDPNTGNNSATDTDTRAGVPSADLVITKTDNSSTYTPDANISYTIEITNSGPDNASGFNITDIVPAAITNLTVSCTTSGTAICGTNSSTGNDVLFTGASVNGGASNKIIITLSGEVAAGTSGALSNTALIVIPSGATFADSNTSNNSATDIDTKAGLPDVDLSITKSSGVSTYDPGDLLTYTITVTNNDSTNTASGFNVTDSVPLLTNNLTVSCLPSGGNSCGTNTTSGTNVAFNGASLGPGGTMVISITGRVSLFQSGPLSNTANIVVPGSASFTDANISNNTATTTDNATLPTCDTIVDVSGTGNVNITNAQVTCLRFTDTSLTSGAAVSLSNSGLTYLRWSGKGEGESGSCGVYTGLLWFIDNDLADIYVDRDTDILLYAQAIFGNDTLTISSISDWPAGCP